MDLLKNFWIMSMAIIKIMFVIFKSLWYIWVPILLVYFLIILFEYLKYNKSNYKNESGNNFLKYYFNTGNYGEGLLFIELEKLGSYKKIMTNLYIPIDDRTTEIDVLMITKKGIYVFESKNYSGWIFGNENFKIWTQVIYQKRNKILNPIWQNKKHILALGGVLKEFDNIRFESYIVFSKRCTLKKITYDQRKYKVIKRNRVIDNVIESLELNDDILSEVQINEIYDYLNNYSHASEELKKEHIVNIKKNM